MKEELLQEIREYAQKKYKEEQEHNIKMDKIKTLSNDKNEKEYLYLSNEKPVSTGCPNYKIKKIFYDTFKSRIYKIGKDETNKIFVETGTFMDGPKDYILGHQSILVNRNDPRADYRTYRDLEQVEEITVPIKQCDDFEKNNNIIETDYYDARDLYYQIRYQFITDMLENSQKESKDNIVKIYVRKK